MVDGTRGRGDERLVLLDEWHVALHVIEGLADTDAAAVQSDVDRLLSDWARDVELLLRARQTVRIDVTR